MEKNKIPTAREFYDLYPSDDTVIMMIEFAKLHVTEALKLALEDSPTGSITDIPSYEDMEDAILNAYPLDLIK